MSDLSWALSDNSIVEWLGLVELLSILSSILVGMSIFFSCPASAIPKRRVHHIPRAIIEQSLSRTIQISFVRHVLLEFYSLFQREFLGRIPTSKHRFGLSLWINKTSAESSLVWLILGVIMRVALRHCFSTISPGSSV